MEFEISILNSFGYDHEEWDALQRALLVILKRDYSFFLNEDDCGHKLEDVLTEEDLEAIAVKLVTAGQSATLNELAVKVIGFASTYHIGLFLGTLMLVGNGECPNCGSNDIDDLPEHREDDTLMSATRLCRSCQYEWNPEE